MPSQRLSRNMIDKNDRSINPSTSAIFQAAQTLGYVAAPATTRPGAVKEVQEQSKLKLTKGTSLSNEGNLVTFQLALT